jgi:hypothetical protein
VSTRRKLVERYELDLVGFLNAATRAELLALCEALRLPSGAVAEMRQRLWSWGAALERRGLGEIDPLVQPAPRLDGGRLRATRPAASSPPVLPSARAARYPAGSSWPRPLPPARDAPPALAAEPSSLHELLERADRLVGVRLPARGRDKGAHGQRIAALLGLPASNEARPDWRGEVEVKTIAVVRAVERGWRLKDGPALSMCSVDATSKLRRVLWIIRVDEGEIGDSPILSWFYQELVGELESAFEAARHLRPKGKKGTHARGWYLRREFFELCGLLRSLNG